GWKGAAPVLLYNRFRTAPFRTGVDYADRFVVYLTNHVDELRPEFTKAKKGKQLLFTIVPNVQLKALETFKHQQNYKMPADGSLPPVYRSDLIDELPRAVRQSGMTKMVVEMRKDNKVVSQRQLDKENWFSLLRLYSSYPYPISRKEFNYFSLEGDASRKFYISNHYGGCTRDSGFIMVSDSRGSCDWVTRGWRGSPPSLAYNREQGRSFHESVGYADRLIIYLAKEVLDPRAEFKKPLIVDGNKQVLFTIKSNINTEALSAYSVQQNYKAPTDGSLPPVYRSDLLDQLALTVKQSGKTNIVAEMEKDDRVTDEITLMNWFSRSRLVSSYPFNIDPKQSMNYFSINGDAPLKRRFLASFSYGSCVNDRGFWMVSDKRDGCTWANEGWKGSAPVLAYNRYRTATLRSGVDYADRFTIYLTDLVTELREEFNRTVMFEKDKQLLFTIIPNVHLEALETFEHQQNYKMPANGSLPPVYRSDLIDELPRAVRQSGMTKMVVEMRKDDNQVVSQVVFDVSTDTEKLDKENWFSELRLESSYPYSVDRKEFNYFSLEGERSSKRRFYINNWHHGCHRETGFILVSDARGHCDYVTRGWRGSAPTLIYSRLPGKPFEESAGYADRLLIYLAKEVPDLRAEFKKPLIIDGNKQVLFTIKSNINTEALSAYSVQQNYKAPTDGSLPPVYRSDLLDQLALTVKQSGKTNIVAEMEKDDRVGARMVFDLSEKTDEITLMNWFSRSRLVSSYPFNIDPKQSMNYFSINGDAPLKRRFLASFSYGSCVNDRGFWMVSDKRDGCTWANEGWKGSAPVLAYNRYRTATLRSGVDYADRFTIYLTDSVTELREEFNRTVMFENDKQLLFTIVPNVQLKALETFKHQQNYKMPADGSLPPVYRSDLIDELPRAVRQSGMTKMVVEMRKDNKVVSQVAFDVSTDTDKLDKENWFSLLRLYSSYPYPISRKEFNYFSLEGDASRKFYISNHYGGCTRDSGFIMVSDSRGSCDWVTRGWRGSPPSLAYNREQGRSFHESVGYADRLIIYLAKEVLDPRAEFKKPLIVDGNKQVLFTIKSNINTEALSAYSVQQNYKVPTDGSLPPVYRSDLLDQLALTVKQSGKTNIVAEMEKDDRVGARMVFDLSEKTDEITLMNWFSRSRLVSSYPFNIDPKQSMNYFSINGDAPLKRRFLASFSYGSCVNDRGFWMVSDKRDGCTWANEGWKGSAPVLAYNRYRTATLRSGVDYADRFTIYLTDSVTELREEFNRTVMFENDKQLLFTIVPNVQLKALETFKHQQNYKMPADGSLPPVYRSDLIDELPRAVRQSGMTKMVVEMRKDNKVVSQVAFDVSTDTDKLDKENWFSLLRLYSSYPYPISRKEFNYFSLEGDASRKFYISNHYGGCTRDSGFIMVSDSRGSCDWVTRGWRGSPPSLAYNREQGRSFHESVGYADRLIIYLAKEVLDPRAEFKKPLIVDGNKQVLFTIKSNINTEALSAYSVQQNYKVPTDGSLPPVYRSDLLDQLALTVKQSGKTNIVAEMEKDDRVGARMVFDLSEKTDEITLMNWFSRSRLVSSYPFNIDPKQSMNYFSINGDAPLKRRFLASFSYGSCVNDRGFWMVSDKRDGCTWANEGWKGSAPVLAYNRYRTATLRSGVDYADRFTIYLTDSVTELREEFNRTVMFENDKQLLFTIVPNVQLKALETFKHQQNYKMPADGSLPPVYRSDLIDELPRAVRQSGMTKMVVEMRKDNKVVSQVAFDVSTDTDKLDKENWFSLLRLYSSYPYPISRKEFNYFSLEGDASRKFYISNHYGGCTRDSGFIMVSDSRGSCDWVTRGWRGSPPSLAYNREQGRSFHESVGYADRLIIYLSNEFLDPRAEYKKIIIFEEYKQLLFTIKANVDREALNVFSHRQDFKMLADGSLPPVYRSDLLDQLALTVKQSGKSRMVVEMREGKSVVSQVIFNVAKDTDKLTRENWFSKERIESSYPFWIGRTEFSQFSLNGDSSRKRHFSISSTGGGCDTERSFFVVSDKEDSCPWISEGFKGSLPVLVYNYIQDAPSRVGSGYADRLVIYLM
uniref:Peptidase S9 n=1 Tax=Macrostomum lignano TaxID=282301 RepID=A0A1I8G660_9PLAT